MKAYAGIGSREAPEFARNLAISCGEELYKRGVLLRSGAARGMDAAFERGHDIGATGRVPNKEIWLPKLGFEKHPSRLLPSPEAFLIAKRIVEHWKNCNEFSRQCHARNAHQVLGPDLKSPVVAVLCYTDGGAKVGGTRTALVLAEELGIPIFNFGNMSNTVDDLINFINKVSN